MSGLLRLPNGLIKEFPEVQQFQIIFGTAGDIVLLLKGRGFETHRETHLLDTLRFIPPAPDRMPTPASLPLLPDAGLILETIANTSWAKALIDEADRILQHNSRS